jgi:hypothetical protein
MSQPTAPAQPLFYRKPEPLSADRHGKLVLAIENTFAFAKEAVAIPLNAVEISAARSYPVVFANTAPWLPLAVMGLRQNENMFVEKDGSWRDGSYVPAYVRRYPFALARQQEQGPYTLCIDSESKRLVKKGGQPLFDGAKATEVIRSAMQFCIAFEQEMDATKRIVEQIHSKGLLVPNQATVTLPSGTTLSLTDFFVIDEKKFAELPDADFLELRGAGALPLIYGHFLSRLAWQGLLRLAL